MTTLPLTTLPSSIRCSGCGHVAGQADPYPFRCVNAGTDDVDHVLVRVLDPTRLSFPREDNPDPFIRYRTLMHSYHLAIAAGLGAEEYAGLVAGRERSVAEGDGRGFGVTPFGRAALLRDRLGFSAAGGVWVKDETGNVSGSHKGRHLMGLLIHLDIAERLGLAPDAALALQKSHFREHGTTLRGLMTVDRIDPHEFLAFVHDIDLAGVPPDDPAIHKALSYLVDQQNADGSWSESDFTGTGFPGVFYLKYHLYRISFPLYTLARFRNQVQGPHEYCAMKFQPAEFRLRSEF